MDEKVMDNLKSESRWLRLLFMVLYLFAGYFAAMLAVLIGVIQAIVGFLTGEPNTRLQAFSASLNVYLYQILEFISYNSDAKPFPFSDWPDNEADSGE